MMMYEMVALKTGIIRKPVPIIPIENNRYERSPASGFNAMAASLMLFIFRMPWSWRMVPVVKIIKYMMSTAKKAPDRISFLMRRNVYRLIAFLPCVDGSIRYTSEETCQKNRYGEMMAPVGPITIKTKSLSK
jgi:hypothetical protein